MVKLIIFAIVSTGIVWISWSSFRDPRSHGFYRFFAFEALLPLILINVRNWFHDPFSILQIVSWFLLCGSIVLAVHGFRLLRIVGRPQGDFEHTTALVTVGAYRYIRHPLYCSLLLLGWGAFFKSPSLIGGILVLVVSTFLIATAKAEEAENLRTFGTDYATYMQRSRMFIPFLL